MTDERIQQIADFFYSKSAYDLPLRLAISVGEFKGADLNKQRCIQLLTILSNSESLENDLYDFLENNFDI